MIALQTLIFIGGILHFGILIGSAQVPRELNFKDELARVSGLLRQWILVAGGYIVLNIVAFGIISLCWSSELASGSTLARVMCGYIAVFWFVRLMIQFLFFDVKKYLRTWFLRVGYHGLTVVFAYQTVVFGAAALKGAW